MPKTLEAVEEEGVQAGLICDYLRDEGGNYTFCIVEV